MSKDSSKNAAANGNASAFGGHESMEETHEGKRQRVEDMLNAVFSKRGISAKLVDESAAEDSSTRNSSEGTDATEDNAMISGNERGESMLTKVLTKVEVPISIMESESVTRKPLACESPWVNWQSEGTVTAPNIAAERAEGIHRSKEISTPANMEDVFSTLDGDAQTCGCSSEKKIYYDMGKKEYLVQNREGLWMRQTETQCRRRLTSYGFSPDWSNAEATARQR